MGKLSLGRVGPDEAIEVVRDVLKFVVVGPPIIHMAPRGEVHIDVPLMYQGFALDRVHFDPEAMAPSPKGRPAMARVRPPSEAEVREVMEEVLEGLVVLEGAEFREPEWCWAVPVAWEHMIIAHIKVSAETGEVVPDYGLTQEVMRHAE